ncbi:MAG TPA: SDR family oxidoreductase [Gemmatimonadaceae bacterium]|nr:SDR family oxidoreductase [Gemmatimonadaceae bacterium]
MALVTGAGHRLGRAFALALGARGLTVAVHYNSAADEAEDTVRLIRAAGGAADTFQADLSIPGAAEALIDAVSEKHRALDVLVNSAAVMLRTPVGEVTLSDWDSIFALNVRAPFMLSQSAARIMREGSTIINIADLAAFDTWPAYVPHAISKAAVVKMTESLARVLAPRIRVNAIAPGAVLMPEGWDESRTSRLIATTPLKRIGDPKDVVSALLFLLDSDFVTGETIVVDGGRRIRK